MYILQYRGTSFISRAIQLATWGKYSHSALADNSGFVIEAWHIGEGVQHLENPYINHTLGTVIDIFYLESENDDVIWEHALSMVGKLKYDFRALLGFVPFLRWLWKDSPTAIFCSHAVALCCRKGDSPLFSKRTPLYKISPTLIPYSLAIDLVGTISSSKDWDDFISQKKHRPIEEWKKLVDK